jgi:hypothetical protein
MDPNATLADIRHTAKSIQDALDAPGTPDAYNMRVFAETLAVLATDLDGWLSKGGFLPDAWTKEA